MTSTTQPSQEFPQRQDRESRAYKLELVVCTILVLGLTSVGGLILGNKINEAEELAAAQREEALKHPPVARDAFGRPVRR